MAEFGPLLRTAQRVFADLSLTEFLNLPDPVLPVHVDVVNDRLAIHVMASVTGDDSGVDALRQVQARGFRVRTYTGHVASGWTYLDDLGTLAETDSEAYLDAAGVVRPELDVSVPEAWNVPAGAAAAGFSGQGTLIGIVDSGIDVTHASFQTWSGNTRIRRLWDQSVQGANPQPGQYAYGSEWTDADIDQHLMAGTPFPSVDRTGHGTAVAGIAAANGYAIPTRRYVGVAPEAELIVVKLDARSHAFASTGNVLDAVAYVFDVAGQLGRRAVVNLSQGARLGSHDGLAELDRGLDDMLRRDADRIVVNSAGNLADANAHARVYVPLGGFVDLIVQVPAYAGPYVAVELWYHVSDRISVQVIDPAGSPGQVISGSNNRGFGALANDVWEVDGRLNVPHVRANQVLVGLQTANHSGDVRSGGWTVRLLGDYIVSGAPLDAWLDSADAEPSFGASVDTECTVTAPGVASEVLAVGAYRLSPTLGGLAPMSSRGPSRLGQPVRLLAAPGDPVTSCAPAGRSIKTHVRGSGTSYAAAHVTGAIALLLEAAPHLDRAQVRDCLEQHARVDADTNAGPVSGWGSGMLDIYAACACAAATP